MHRFDSHMWPFAGNDGHTDSDCRDCDCCRMDRNAYQFKPSNRRYAISYCGP